MGILTLFKRQKTEKDTDKEQIYTFSDTDRSLALEKRRLSAKERRILKQIELKEYEIRLKELEEKLSEFDEQNEDEPDNDVEQIAGQAFLSLISNFGKPQTTNTPMATQISLSDADIRELISKMMNQKMRKKLSNLSDNVLSKMARTQFPQFDDDTIKRAMIIIREK